MGNAKSEFAVASPQVLKQIKDSIVTVDGARVSELVEDTQSAVVNSAGEDALEQAANRATRGHRFTPECYDEPACMNAYLIDFFSENVLKLQLILHDLLRDGRLPKKLCVLDIGVGTGTTAIAIFDFLRIWVECSDTDLPIEDVCIVGIDRCKNLFDFADGVVQAYATALSCHVHAQSIDRPFGSFNGNIKNERRIDKIVEWARRGTQRRIFEINLHNVEMTGAEFDEMNMIVAADVLNELRNQSPDAERTFNNLVAHLPTMELAIIIVPSVGGSAANSELGNWYRGFLDSCPKNLRHEFSVVLDEKRCERFNPHPLNLQFYKLRGKNEKRHFSWRYRVLQRSGREKEASRESGNSVYQGR